MSDTWVNWADFMGANKSQLQAQSEQQEALAAQQQAMMDKALASLDASGLSVARDGKFQGVDKLAGYSQMMAQRDASLQAQTPRQQGAPWEAAMGQKEYRSPWADLSKRLGSMNQQLGARNTQAQNQQAYQKQQEEIRRFQAEQKAKLDAAINGKSQREGNAYAEWSDAVQRSGSRYRGSAGAGAYYDAAQGTGTGRAPQPVTAGYNQTTKDIQRKLRNNNQNQLMPESSSSNFGYSTSGF